MIPAESAHDTVAALGDAGALHFKDLNAGRGATQRPHANMVRCMRPLLAGCMGPGMRGRRRVRAGETETPAGPAHLTPPLRTLCVIDIQVRRCDEMARRISYLRDEVAGAGLAGGVVAPAAADASRGRGGHGLNLSELEVRGPWVGGRRPVFCSCGCNCAFTNKQHI